MLKSLLLIAILISTCVSKAQTIKGLPSLPTSGKGLMGSVGAGFADFKTQTPSDDFRVDRGAYFTTQIERGFNVINLYLTLGLNYMSAAGDANYRYSNLTSSHQYSVNNLPFKATMYEVTLGLKWKLIDEYWFRPYIEGGGIGSYNQVVYDSTMSSTVQSVGTDYKAKDIIMGAGYYGEGGFEIQFAEKFGVRLAARQAIVQTKKLETLSNRPIRTQNEIYYLALMFGF